MSDNEARAANVGGEVLCQVFRGFMSELIKYIKIPDGVNNIRRW